MSLQNFTKLSAAVHELSLTKKKRNKKT